MFKRTGVSKVLLAIVPDDFKLSTFLPIPSGTPVDGIKFKNMALVIVPKGAAKNGVSTSGLPEAVSEPLAHLGQHVDFKAGLNLFGQADFTSSGAIKKVLSAVGHNKFTLPLGGAFSADVFKHDLKTASQKLKEELLVGLTLNLPLPKLHIPGMPNIVYVDNAHLAIVGREVKGKRKIFAGVTGGLHVKVGNSRHVFNFGILASDPGKQFKATITAESKDKVRLPFIHPLDLTDMKLTATRKGGKWKTEIDAKAKLNNKTIDVTYIHDANNQTYVDIKTKITLADLSPIKLPGLTDVELDEVKISKEITNVKTKFRKIPAQLAVFKQPGSAKHFISLVPQSQGGKPATFSPAQLIPGTANTPLKDVTFQDMAFVYNPYPFYFKLHSTLPSGITKPIKLAKVNMSVAPGLNVFGHMEVHPTGEVATLLKKVGVTDLTLPLNGGFSPKAFSKNLSGTAIKNAILDHLDIKINLPPLAIPGIGKFLTFTDAKLHVKGKTPSGARGIDVAISGDADVHVKGDKVAFHVDVEYDKAGGSSELSFKGSTKRKWTHPLGIKFLDLEKLTLDIKKKKQVSGDSSFDIKMAAKTDIGSHSKLDVKIDVHEKNGTVTDAFFELDGPLKLSEIPGVKDIPSASHFEIDTLKISEHGIEAKTSFGGKSDLDIFLFSGSGWNLIVRQDNLALSEFVPPLSHTPIKHVVLSEAAIVLSKDGLSGPMSGFSIIAQDALRDIYGKNASNIDVDSGLSLIAAFEHKKSKGGMAGAFSRLGLKEEKLILTGDIGGLFGGPTKLDIKVSLSAHTGAKNQPRWMRSKPGVTAEFSMVATESDGNFDVEFGIGVDIIAYVHGARLLFDAKVALEFEDEKIDVKIVANLKDKAGWHKPFGIRGFTLYEVGLDLGIDEDGAIHLGFDGNIKVSGNTFKIAADADLLPEALGAPQDIAFVGSADKVDMFFMEAIAIDMIGSHFKLDIPTGILPEFTKVKFAFVTPGAADPDLHITGQGFALAGGMTWLGHELGKMNVSVSPLKGITASGKIDDMSLGPLQLKKNHFSLKAAPTGVPDLHINSNIELLGAASERFLVKISKTGVDMSAHIGAGTAADMTAGLKLSGIDLGAKKPDFKKADFAISGDVKLDVRTFISGPAQTALNDMTKGLKAAFKAGKKAIKTAEGKIKVLTPKINKARAKVRREKAAAEGKVQDAENRVNGLQSRLSNQWASYHHCHGWDKWPCRVREGIRIGWTDTEISVADAALDLAKSLISHFPIDLDPAVAKLLLERDTAREALHLAQKAIEGADDLTDFSFKAVTKLLHAASSAADINIKKASFKGDVQGIIKNDEPVDLAIDVVLFGAEIKDQFAFKIKSIGKDLAGDVEQLALLGLYALDHLIENGVGSIPGPLKNKLKGAVAKKMDAKGAAHKRELAKYAKEFSNYNKTADALRSANTAYNTAFLAAQLANSSSSLDSEKTETFANDLIEVGHTGLCLSNTDGRVKQDRCADGAGGRWTTVAASGATGVKAGAGYVYITQAKGGDCIVPEGAWATVKQKFSDPKLPKEGSFTFEESVFKGDGKITVAKCVNSTEYYWKVLQHGDGWMQMANLATNRCLHFSNSSSVPGNAQAEWKACTGAANQVYRIADSASPKIYKANIALRNDAQSACFSGPNKAGQISVVSCTQAAHYDYAIDIRGYIRFINNKTGKCLQPEGYWNGARVVERGCTQLDYQWWDPIAVPGGWRIKNAQVKRCAESPGLGGMVKINDCHNWSKLVIAPITDPHSGVTFKSKAPTDRPRHYNASYAGTPSAGICSMGGIVGYSWLTGTLDGNECKVAVDDRIMVNGGKRQLYIASIDGAEWVDSGGGKLPVYAIPTGYREGPKWGGWGGSKTAYACRTKFRGKSGARRGKEFTGVGWTIDGKTCQYVFHGTFDATTFEVLARLKDKSYELKLDDYWPVPKPGVWYPGLPHVVAKKH